MIQLEGQPVVGATQYEQEVLRCSACQLRYTAPLPEGVKAEKYTPSADVAIVLAKYAAGLPFYRLARVQAHIERHHLNFRTRVKRLQRLTICYSRSPELHDAVIKLFIHYSNSRHYHS